ncbi:MAG: lipid A export permease/ATP-binding protein MsbA [Thermodesulfobacteriota bacterium]|nr:lipid A export permease/ATP-binding protein MsbA [Thermodesulfobacteriota bacterium]
MSIYKRLLNLIVPYWKRMAVAMICMVGVALLTSATAYVVKPMLDEVFFKKDMTMIHLIPLAIVFLFLSKGIFYYGYFYLINSVGQKIVADLREAVYRHLNSLSLSYFHRTPTGVLISRVLNDVGMIQGAVSNVVVGILKDTFTVIGLTFVIFYQDWRLALIAMTIFPVAVIPIVKFGRKLRKISTKSQQIVGDVTVLLHEGITGSRIVKAFTMEEYEIKRFRKQIKRLYDIIMSDVKVKAVAHPLMELLGGIGIAFIVWYGGLQVIKGTSTPGTFFSFLTAMIMLYEPVKNLSGANSAIQQGVAGAIRVFDLLDTPPEIRDKEGAVALPPIKRHIEFKNVSFKYDEAVVLKDTNLKVKTGEILAIVGMSGGGKTTLVNLIPRFYDITDGAISIDGIDIRDVTISSLRSQIGIVTQQTILFNDTVRNNIAYGDVRKSEGEIIEAARAAYAYDFIKRLPQRWDTAIGEQGVRLSGGERQRISIARALLKNAPILILDEATSSLDTESELEVQKALDNLMQGRTTLVIAHRLSTIRNADRIIVIKDGAIVEEGKHDELLALGGEYRKLHDMQFRDELDIATETDITTENAEG